ncbi:cytochrome P450 [Trichoderma citrinoviride]|uniref:Cytochrome P450 n=1 Tax=Trichoderma citrinoviride TaxID=58853 RepID=A0A2T4B822_9HYPO|nr:cytochrome P450 [Trichoderma citrinoviride]PTB65475.1 cytochrome P450 [Trichoderma citrinoviride]
MDELKAQFAESNLSAVQKLLALTGLPVLYILGLTIYRLYFHPLAKFPGPKLAAATRWYEFYYDIIKKPGAQFFVRVGEMHDEYGPIVRINPHEIHIRDPSFVDTLYATNPTKRDKYLPTSEIAGLSSGSNGTVDHDLHRRRRMANSRMFSKRAVAGVQELIRGHIKELTQVFERKVGSSEPIELQTTFLAYTTDVVYHYMFNRDAGLQKDCSKAQSWRHSMVAVSQAIPFCRQFPWLNAKLLMLPDWIRGSLVAKLQPDIAGLLATHKLMGKIAADYVAHRNTEKGKREFEEDLNNEKPLTIFHSIDRSTLPQEEKTSDRLMQEGLIVLFAGSDTISRLLSHTIYHLLDNPELLDKVRKEILDAAGDCKDLPDVKVLETLPWLAASVRESLRLRAAVTSRLPLVSRKDLVYENWVIPAGIPVSMSHPDILHNEEIYPEASKFKPERWFNATEQQNKMFIPFGRGSRMCTGMDFAYTELYMSLSTLITRFDLELFDTDWERDVAYTRDCAFGEASRGSPGIRVKVLADNKRWFAE